jgi:hypothetical protein
MPNPSKAFLRHLALKRNLIAWIILVAVSDPTPLTAQYYTLRSVEGKKVSVHVEELSHELRISCVNDTLLLYEYFGEYHARALDPSLLQITYAVRGGSGLGLRNTAILAVRDGHLRQALLLRSGYESVGDHYHETFNTSMQLSGNGWSNYVLTVNARKYLRDRSHPGGTQTKFHPLVLRFDSQLTTFCSKTVVADSAFTAIECNHNIEYVHISAGDTLPMVKLAYDPYYYVEGSWFNPIDRAIPLQQDTVVDKVFKLPAVLEKSAWIDSVTLHRHGISLIMLESADWPSDTGRYVLQAGYHSHHQFYSYYLFTVYQPNWAIKTLIQASPTENPLIHAKKILKQP